MSNKTIDTAQLTSAYAELDKNLSKKFGEKYFGFTTGRNIGEVTRISTDCITLDRVLGGGIPEGRMIEVFGPPSASKTTLCLSIVKAYQKAGLACFWVDAERAFDPKYARACGVDPDTLGILEPLTANDALESVRLVAKSGVVSLIILDSTAALVPQDEYEKDAGSGMIGSVARIMSQMLKQIVNIAADNKCTVIFINQLRASNLTGYGSKTTTTGGNALEYYSSIRLEVTKAGFIEDKGEKTGININIQTKKNKTHSPFKIGELSVYFPFKYKGEVVAGVDRVGDILDNALNYDVIAKGGSWLTYKDQKVQGKDKMRALLLEDEALLADLEATVRTKLNDIDIKEQDDEQSGKAQED
jgi:recombination protein RecA